MMMSLVTAGIVGSICLLPISQQNCKVRVGVSLFYSLQIRSPWLAEDTLLVQYYPVNKQQSQDPNLGRPYSNMPLTRGII